MKTELEMLPTVAQLVPAFALAIFLGANAALTVAPPPRNTGESGDGSS